MKYYIDCGANIGSSVIDWRNWIGEEEFSKWTVHAFEPVELKWRIKYPNVTLHRTIAGNYDGFENIYVSPSRKKLGSSILPEKEGNGQAIRVPCIDLNEFIKELKPEYLVLKMNIEGFEYKLLPHLINCGSIKLVDELYVAFHAHKKGMGNYKEFQQNLIEDLHQLPFKRFKITGNRKVNLFE
jgi:FkbM family methyltransferase